ncbi:uncharacterized protein LOC114247207 [Bombyx mandarina]|uniref:Uncharacterized protein LOC114247207 n=1 Tax=Bombyx mandarina TaxID=7092 RepID=A0A6J2K4I9_BOMMA|nr:uncharacterized protein LOC114247207 [Bombyx mandarina]
MGLNKMASDRHATPFIKQNVFICVVISLLLPRVNEGATKIYEGSRGFPNDDGGRRLTREYHLRQGALRGLIVKPNRQYDLQLVEMFLGIPYAAPPTGNFRYMPPVSAPPWQGVRMATHFAPVCPQSLPLIKKGNPPSLGRQRYLNKLKPFLSNESEDCLYLNIYVPYREQKSKKFPVLVFIHGDSFEWSSGNPYDGRILSSYGNIMFVTVNYRLGILGFMKPSLTEHVYGNNGLLDQLAALQWIKDNIEDLNGDPNAVTLMGHGTGAASVNYLMLSPISNGLFHRAILMSGSALSDWAMTRDPTQYTLQVAQSLGCSPNSKNLMNCMQKKPLSEIKKVQILSREFETPLGPAVAGSFVPSEPAQTMEAFPNLLSKYQLLSGVTELESYHDFGVIELDHGILENQRDDFIKKYAKIIFEGAENEALKEIIKEYAPSKLNPESWSVESNRDLILDLLSDARTLSPAIRFANYHSAANRQSYFYVFGHNSVSTEYAQLNKSVHGQEIPYVLGVPLGGANTHFDDKYTLQEKLLSEVIMRLWTNFVKNGSPNTQSVNKYYTLDANQQSHYNVDWPEYVLPHQPYLKLDIPPSISSLYRSNYTSFWIETLPKMMSKFMIDPLFQYTPSSTPKTKPSQKTIDPIRKIWSPHVISSPSHFSSTNYGRVRPYYEPDTRPDPDTIYREIQSINTPSRPVPHGLMEKATGHSTTAKPQPTIPVKTSSATVTLIVSLGVLFLAVNVAIFSILYFKKRKLRIREQTLHNSRQSRAEVGEVDVIGQKSSKDDKSALKTLKNGCSVIKTMSLNKMKGSKKVKKKSDPCKSPKSDDSGGFRERFQLRRHLSTSTLDAHTKVRDWITNDVLHRCSPAILRKSNSDLNADKHINVTKPFTRSEEILSNTKKKKDSLKSGDLNSKKPASKNHSSKTPTSEKTTSTSALESHSSIASHKQSLNSWKQTSKSNDSIKSKGTESIKSKKVSVAIDATPSARTNSILNQEPIEVSKSFDQGEKIHSNSKNQLQRSKTESDFKADFVSSKHNESDTKTYTNVVTLSLGKDKPLMVSHKHSTSDPVSDINYEQIFRDKMEAGAPIIDILPPVTFRNDVNVTSRDDSSKTHTMTPEEALLTIKRRNYPKVLPDLPKMQKRLSLQPNSLQTFRSFCSSTESQPDRQKIPPQPPPRTTTLEKRMAYANVKPLSSFGVSNDRMQDFSFSSNYENIDTLTPSTSILQSLKNSFERSMIVEKPEPALVTPNKERMYPKVIIASSDITSEPKILIKPSPSQQEISANVPRVRLPDDFHSQTTGSITSFSSFCSDDGDEIEDFDDIAEDKLIQELVGGVESPTNMEDVLDSKGPDNLFEKKLEIVPVRINPGNLSPRNKDDYICITDLHLPDVSNLEKTAQIKPNFGLNKLQHRTDSINRPPEKSVRLRQRKGSKSSILNRSLKCKSGEKKSDSSKLEHSNSGSSNDTETSTGTVKKIEVKK